MTGRVGLVPTMGALHAGHLALVAAARAANDHVIVTIFVNPTQFAANEDLAKYPRDLPHDLELLRSAGVDVVFTPTPDLMYPAGFQTWVDVIEVAKGLEGARRPGHFRGVATVVAKLFNLTQPDEAYFGQKDAQQVAVIQRMVRDMNFPLRVVVCPLQDVLVVVSVAVAVVVVVVAAAAAVVAVSAVRLAAAAADVRRGPLWWQRQAHMGGARQRRRPGRHTLQRAAAVDATLERRCSGTR